VHQLVIKGFSIVDARCNHEVYIYTFQLFITVTKPTDCIQKQKTVVVSVGW